MSRVYQPLPLTTICSGVLVKQCWFNSGVVPLFLQHVYATVSRDPVPVTPSMTLYVRVIEDVADRILAWDHLPRNWLIKIANVFLDFDVKMREFIMSMAKAIHGVTKEKIRFCLKNTVITAEGLIDRQRTIIDVCMSEEMDITFQRGFTSYYCVGEKTVLKRYQERGINVTNVKDISTPARDVKKLFGDPEIYWEIRSTQLFMEENIFVYVTTNGCPEALEYFYEVIPADEREWELSVAADFVILMNGCTCERLIFFFKKFSESTWKEFLKRNFCDIFKVFFFSKRYRHMCTLFFSQVYDVLDKQIILWTIHFVAQQFILDYPRFSLQALEMSEAESILLYIWRRTPIKHKKSFGADVFEIIKRALVMHRYKLIATMIDDPAFDQYQKKELVSIVMMNMIIHNKKEQIKDFLEYLKPEICTTNTDIDNFLKYEYIKLFITLGDSCKHVNNYNKILECRLKTPAEIEMFKRNLLVDREFIESLILAMKEDYVQVANFNKLLFWLFDCHRTKIHDYVTSFLLTQNYMRDIFLNYLMGSRKSLDTLGGFNLTPHQVTAIKTSITSNWEPLFDHCANLLLDDNYRALSPFLQSLWKSDHQRHLFLIHFFQSSKGAHAVYSLIIDEIYNEEMYCLFQLHSKLRKFVRFCRYWVPTEFVADSIDIMLSIYGHPNASTFSMRVEPNENLLPHENYDSMRVIADANYRFFRCMLLNKIISEALNATLLMSRVPLCHLTELSVTYGIQAGVDVPVVL